MKKKIFVPVTIVLVIIAIIAGSGYLAINSKLSKIKITKISKNPSDLSINTKRFNTANDISKNYTNILLMGSDSRDPETDPGLVDSIMILTLDKAHNKIKITSLMRDMLIDNIQGEGATAGTTQDRINVIYKQGGGQYSIKAINSNFDMDIKDYIKVDFTHFDKIVDAVGGIDMDVSADEVEVANGYIREAAKLEGTTPPLLTQGGMQHLNGIQALGYSRIRYVGRTDFQRTERQRAVLTQVFRKLYSLNIADATAALDTIFPDVETSLSKTDILSDVSYIVTNKIRTIEQFRLPEDKPGYNYTKMINDTYFLGWDKTLNVADLHQFIFEGDLK
ncbi:LCP family protein [Clostridium pasteurianum]|uniref:Cell envelope-related function transcriptional attenuator common domain protein n=1 Tax=Clostridium pasteurianum BC1 TaxID=86416 RepID=R4K889_CLOPA|nr:LCP family protein [Clostridium pasteurianum]AGK95855.1 cell envelope-related function transcriptional attenuator common domain protein [Clostridium pasteurianum BC1]